MVTDSCVRNCLTRNYVPYGYIDPIVKAALSATSAYDLEQKLKLLGIPTKYIDIALLCYNQCNK